MTKEIVNPNWDSEENRMEGLISDLGGLAVVWEDGRTIYFIGQQIKIGADFCYSYDPLSGSHTYRPLPGKTEKVERWFARKRLQWPNLEPFLILPEED